MTPSASPSPTSRFAEPLKRRVLMAIFALSWFSSLCAWIRLEMQGQSSPVLRIIFGANLVFHPCGFVLLWRGPASWLHAIERACVLFAAGLCGACMVLRLYTPEIGGSIDLQPLYLWIPLIHVFVFTRPDYRANLKISLRIFACFVLASAPYVLRNADPRIGNFTIQLHFVSAILIAGLYLLSSYLQRFRDAQLTADDMAVLANTDELTQVANRRRSNEVLQAEMVRFARYGRPFSIVLLDIDHFKQVNDTLGHASGDKILVAVAARVGALLRASDTLGRWGGEEFLVVLPETDFDASVGKAEAICLHVAAAPADDYSITVSCGVASAKSGDSVDAILERADAALYEAKSAGRNRARGVRS